MLMLQVLAELHDALALVQEAKTQLARSTQHAIRWLAHASAKSAPPRETAEVFILLYLDLALKAQSWITSQGCCLFGTGGTPSANPCVQNSTLGEHDVQKHTKLLPS